MADAAVVATQLEQIERYYGELLSKQDVPKDTFLSDVTERRAVERMFENAIQACVDLAKHVATEDFGYQGDSSKEAVELLEGEVVTRKPRRRSPTLWDSGRCSHTSTAI